MKKIVCDLCKDVTKEAYSRAFQYGRHPDPAGGHDPIALMKNIDLCAECECYIYLKAFELITLPSERNKLIVKTIGGVESEKSTCHNSDR